MTMHIKFRQQHCILQMSKTLHPGWNLKQGSSVLEADTMTSMPRAKGYIFYHIKPESNSAILETKQPSLYCRSSMLVWWS
jgi:hypothetical protein